MERRNITLEKKHLDILSPLLEKNEGNISASIRDIIDFAGLMIKSYGSLENAISDAVSSERIENQRVLVDQSIWQWLLEVSRGILPEREAVKNLFEPALEFNLEYFTEQINDLCTRLGWKTKILFKKPLTFILSGGSEKQRELILKIMCLYMVNHNLGIEHVSSRYSITKIDLTERNNDYEAYKDCLTYLGYLDKPLKEIRSRPEFWDMLVNAHSNTNYQMVTINKKNYEKLLSGNLCDYTDMFSVFTGLPCQDINLQKLLPIIKSVFETSRIVDRIDIDQDILRIFHSYNDLTAIEKINHGILNILEKNGYHYEAVQVSSIIVLQHKSEVEGRITELVDNLLSTKGGFNQELMAFLIFLDGIKEKTQINSTVKKLGVKTGEQILTEYEKEFNVEHWDLEQFKKAFSDVDKKLGRESDLELIDPNVMHYIVNKCQIVHPHGKFNIHLCNLTHGMLKGAVDYAFKGDAIIKPRKMIGLGDNFCEFYVVLTTKLKMPDDKSYDL